jgi:putative tricarboxylic transport membrane protein
MDYALWCLLGTVYGILLGVIPMAGAGTAMLLVFSFAGYFDPNPYYGLIFLISVIAASSTADSYTSLLTGIPGASTTAASIIDGYKMSKNGEAARAIGIAMADSTFNGILFGLLAFALLPFYAPIIYKFGVPELFMFMTLSIACVAFIVSKNFWLSCVAIGIGAFIGLIGIDPQTQGPRFAFGTLYLQDGVPIIMMIAGLFGIPELISGFKWGKNRPAPINNYFSQLFNGFTTALKLWKDSLRGGLIGFIAGILPGVGPVGDMLAYGATVKAHPNDKFGVGNPKGLAGCEGANNAQKAGSLIPTVLFGIPASPFAAIFMAMCITFGLDVGNPFMLEDKKFLSLLGYGFVGATILTFIICIFTSKLLVKILEIPYPVYALIIFGIIIYTCQSYTGLYMDYVTLAACSVLGLFCYKFKISRPAILLTYIIIDKWQNLGQQWLTMYSWDQMLTRPLFLVLFAGVLFLVYRSITQKNRGIDYA